MKNLLPNAEIFRQGGAVAGGVTNVDLPEIEVKGAAGVAWLVSTATQANTGVCQLVAQGRNSSGDSWADLTGASVSHTSDGSETGNLFGLEVRAPKHRYLRCSIRRTVANTAIESAVALMLDMPNAPVAAVEPEFFNTVLSPG